MSGSEQHNRVAMVCTDHPAILRRIVNRNLLDIDFGERQTLLEDAQGMLWILWEYIEHTAVVQRVCDHPAQTIALQKQITDLESHQFMPL